MNNDIEYSEKPALSDMENVGLYLSYNLYDLVLRDGININWLLASEFGQLDVLTNISENYSGFIKWNIILKRKDLTPYFIKVNLKYFDLTDLLIYRKFLLVKDIRLFVKVIYKADMVKYFNHFYYSDDFDSCKKFLGYLNKHKNLINFNIFRTKEIISAIDWKYISIHARKKYLTNYIFYLNGISSEITNNKHLRKKDKLKICWEMCKAQIDKAIQNNIKNNDRLV